MLNTNETRLLGEKMAVNNDKQPMQSHSDNQIKTTQQNKAHLNLKSNHQKNNNSPIPIANHIKT